MYTMAKMEGGFLTSTYVYIMFEEREDTFEIARTVILGKSMPGCHDDSSDRIEFNRK